MDGQGEAAQWGLLRLGHVNAMHGCDARCWPGQRVSSSTHSPPMLLPDAPPCRLLRMSWPCWRTTTGRGANTLRQPQRQTRRHMQPCSTSSRCRHSPCRHSQLRPCRRLCSITRQQRHTSQRCSSHRHLLRHRLVRGAQQKQRRRHSARGSPSARSSPGRCTRWRGCRWMPSLPSAASRPAQ